uniref:hypothetical protein n=1 Tax=Klebsiella pneumoniae TaxID=573 RepID=UPI0022BA68F2|nr:hypothetical protein [Klebsiella pneumoniae]VXZ93140.1 Uncharacterised protein [Klebsiella pneumoniae]
MARTRGYKHGITIKCRPGRPQKWLKGRIKPLEDAEGTNLCWIDTATIVHIGAGQQFDDQVLSHRDHTDRAELPRK